MHDREPPPLPITNTPTKDKCRMVQVWYLYFYSKVRFGKAWVKRVRVYEIIRFLLTIN